jgi:cell division protein ZapA (FtsZ GTPase activity inhibitor)
MRRVTIDILGHQYSIKTDGNEEYVQRIADYVNAKTREVMEATQTVSTVDLFIKVAVNLTDELLQERAAKIAFHRSLEEETKRIIGEIEAHLGGNAEIS